MISKNIINLQDKELLLISGGCDCKIECGNNTLDAGKYETCYDCIQDTKQNGWECRHGDPIYKCGIIDGYERCDPNHVGRTFFAVGSVICFVVIFVVTCK